MRAATLKIKLKGIVEDVDERGNVRIYYRAHKGARKIRIRAMPGTEEFMTAYHAAVAGKLPASKPGKLAPVGSFRWLCQKFFDDNAFKRLDQSTKDNHRRHLDSLCEQHGDKPFALLTPKRVARLVSEISEKTIDEDGREVGGPAAANQRRKALRALFKWGFKNLDEVESNPTLGVDRVDYNKRGHHTWTPEEVAQYRKRHAIGTKPRLALELLLGTACRREDAPRLGRQHIHDAVDEETGATYKRLKYRQGKNEDRSPVDIDMPLPAELAEAIDATPSGHLTFLVTAYGKPYTTNGFGNAFKDWCAQAKLPSYCTAHGLRKRRSADLVESGATSHEGMSITGHKTLAEFERYTKDANRKKLADAAIKKTAGRVGHSLKKA